VFKNFVTVWPDQSDKALVLFNSPTGEDDMNIDFTRWTRLIAALALGAFVGCSTAAQAFDDSAALVGIKEGKIAFDIKEGNGKLLLAQLGIIEETRQLLIQQRVKPHIVMTFRGPASKLVQTDQEKIKPEDREMAVKIAARIKEMSKAPGIEGFEQCALATRQQDTKPELVLPEIRVVADGFISLMAYQARGYAYIAP
jgi:intracellular sulfur oxidation DsrE/DsrF family protein